MCTPNNEAKNVMELIKITNIGVMEMVFDMSLTGGTGSLIAVIVCDLNKLSHNKETLTANECFSVLF